MRNEIENVDELLGDLHPLHMSEVSFAEIAVAGSVEAAIRKKEEERDAEEVGIIQEVSEKAAEKAEQEEAAKDANELSSTEVRGTALETPKDVEKAENVLKTFDLQQQKIPREAIATVQQIDADKVLVIVHRYSNTEQTKHSGVETTRLSVYEAYAQRLAQQANPGTEFKAMVLTDEKIDQLQKIAADLPIQMQDLHNYKDVESLNAAMKGVPMTSVPFVDKGEEQGKANPEAENLR